MSLDVRQLEKVRELASGMVQARCPACAEGGSDKAGEHLRIYPDGRFGCCVHPKDAEHRKRIFALAGDKSPRSFTVKAVSGKAAAAPAKSVAASLTGFFRTVRTPVSTPVSTSPQTEEDFRTLRTPLLNPRTHGREGVMGDETLMFKDSENGVLSVLAAPKKERLPYLTPGGVLGIPFDSPERFHWWRGGQSIAETRREVLADGHHANARKDRHAPGI